MQRDPRESPQDLVSSETMTDQPTQPRRVWTIDQLDSIHPLREGWDWMENGPGCWSAVVFDDDLGDEDGFDVNYHCSIDSAGNITADGETPLDVALAVILVHMGLDAIPSGREQVIESALATIRFDPEDALRKADITAHDTFDAMLTKACAGRTVVSAIAFVQTDDGNMQALAFHPAGHLVTCTAANAQGFALEVWRTHGCPRTPEDAAAASRRLEQEAKIGS